MLAHFQGGLRELDVSSVAGEVTLLALGSDDDNDSAAADGGDTAGSTRSTMLQVHVHARSRAALGCDALAQWLSAWLSLGTATADIAAAATITAEMAAVAICGDEKAMRVHLVHAYPQARPGIAPLSPLREKGCVVVPLPSALVVLCGDWAVGESAGTVSGALLSAYRAAREVAEYIKSPSP